MSIARVTAELSTVREVWKDETARLRDRMLELSGLVAAAESRFFQLQRDSSAREAVLLARIEALESRAAIDGAERISLGRELDRITQLSQTNSVAAKAAADELAASREHCAFLEAEVSPVAHAA